MVLGFLHSYEWKRNGVKKSANGECSFYLTGSWEVINTDLRSVVRVTIKQQHSKVKICISYQD